MKRITPLKILGILSVLLGLTVAILTGGYLVILGAYFIGFALLLFLLDWLTKKTKIKKAYWIS
ncbi:MAG: hypothetical protein AB8G11_18175, partial [Saprospiraceae bacterium]